MWFVTEKDTDKVAAIAADASAGIAGAIALALGLLSDAEPDLGDNDTVAM